MAGSVFWASQPGWGTISRRLREKFNATMRIDEIERLPKLRDCQWCFVLTVSVHDLDKDQDDGELHCRQLVLHFSRERGAFIDEDPHAYRRKEPFVLALEEWLTSTEAALRLGAS